MLDLPQPFGPTTPSRLLGRLTVVGSTKDLNPASLILLSRIALRAEDALVSNNCCKAIEREVRGRVDRGRPQPIFKLPEQHATMQT
jgi:hypothetical protein